MNFLAGWFLQLAYMPIAALIDETTLILLVGVHDGKTNFTGTVERYFTRSRMTIAALNSLSSY
jgi:hypothetical protein